MGLFSSLFGHRDPAPAGRVRAVIAFKEENRKAAAKRTSVMLQLAVYAATTTPSQRKREAEAAIARLRETERAGR